MSDEVRLTAGIGRGVNKQIGKLPRAKKRQSSESKEKNKKPAKEIESGAGKAGSSKSKGTHGETKTGGVHGETPIKVSSERVYPSSPKQISNPPKALEAPGSFVATPVVNLDEGPNFGKVENQISRVPRQFRN